MDSGEEFDQNDSDWVLYKDRSDWADVTPVPQQDGPHAVVTILYSDKFKDVYDYFRAILQKNEKSERALELTEDALELNPANYTVWQYRREILKDLNKDLMEELFFVRGMIESNPKNYQVWHHRRVIVEWLQKADQELVFTAIILAIDSKNYHAWQHRQWVIRTFNLYDNELEFVDKLIDLDVRNNSAWNQRYFVLNNTTQFPADIIEREVNYCMEKIKLAPGNESVWNFLRGVMFHAEPGSPIFEQIKQFGEELFNSGNTSPYLFAYLVDLYEELSDREHQHSGGDNALLEKAITLCDLLANEHDKIRIQYWKYIRKGLEQKKI